jgi:peptidoglycan hydrolase-like protein with peptidoglycan-binding domain
MSILTGSVGLRGDNRGADVLTIETLLHDNGYLPVAPNRNFNRETLNAIRAFQRTFMTTPTGLIEPDSESEVKLISLNPVAAAMGTMAGWVNFISGGPVARAVVMSRVAPNVATQISSRAAYYPLRPSFNAMTHAEREAAFGGIEFDDIAGSDNITITRRDADYIIERVAISQLTTIPNAAGGLAAGGRIRCHRLAGPRFQALFQAWDDAGLLDRINHYSGPYVARYKRRVAHDGNSSSLSNHAWGTAIDLNVPQNRLGDPPARLGEVGCLLELVPIANALGFYWGGHFSGRLDGMHFEIGTV